MKKINLLLLVALLLSQLVGCTPEPEETVVPTKQEEPIKEDPKQLIYGTGLLDNERLDKIESDIYLGSSGNLPGKVDLAGKFPPIGNQGTFGTCVAWAIGYNLKTYLEGVDQQYSTDQLMLQARQFSPKDLFYAIPSSKKGQNCDGTNFETAFDILVDRGVATMATVPYQGMGGCSALPLENWNQEANQFRIDNYRRINHKDVNVIKSYLANSRPVVFGARLGDGFMKWKSTGVLMSDTYQYNGQHLRHAMIIAGYDDSKNAFRIINSWGKDWGDNGFIWIDYRYFTNDFCFSAFVAQNKRSATPEKQKVVNGQKDLIPYHLKDGLDKTDNTGTSRYIEYSVQNTGSESIQAKEKWSYAYLYYNAYDANDWGMLLYHDFSGEFFTKGRTGLITGPASSGNASSNVDLPGGKSIQEMIFGNQQLLQWKYRMPRLNGYYYLVMIADAYNTVKEYDESNNYHFFTDKAGYAMLFKNGYTATEYNSMSSSKGGRTSKGERINTPEQARRNAYSPQEIRWMVENHKKSGRLQQKANAFQQEERLPESVK